MFPVIFEDEAMDFVRKAERKHTGIYVPSANGETVFYYRSMFNYDGIYCTEWTKKAEFGYCGMSSAQMAKIIYRECNKYGKMPILGHRK